MQLTAPGDETSLFDSQVSDESDLSNVGTVVGDQLGDFRLERRLGKGGMGEVFAARHVETGELVALKTLANARPLLRYRFKREFRALADVEHRNLVRLGVLVSPEIGPTFFTMQLVDGRPFVEAIRRATPIGQLPDIARLEDALRQLVEGIECLHANQCVHRDLKPSNVMITESGDLKILDFGIIAELTDSDHGVTREGQVLGTPTYMAPEQAAGGRPGPAVDYYAVGVMLYECLTGQVPFPGSGLQVLVDKQTAVAPDPGLVVAGVPGRLRELCLALLERDAQQRPTGPEILARLGASRPPKRGAAGGSAFVGRTAELAALHQAFADVGERHHAVTVHLLGRSGYGKSTLVKQFLLELHKSEQPVILRGRCRERETLPYKGVDAVIDALALHLRHFQARPLGDAELAALRPRHLGALVRVFPVFDEIWNDETPPLDGLALNEARSAGWAALREILSRLATRGRLVVVIDDFQWADDDSVAILRALTREPDAPALLLVVTTRDVASPMDSFDRDDEQAPGEGHRDLRRLALGPLPERDARELAHALLRAHADAREIGTLHSRAEAVALRCAGSPFFIEQMVLAAAGDPSLAGAANLDVDLDQIVLDRLAQLDAAARELLAIVAVGGGPLPRALLHELGVLADPIERLCSVGLLVRSEQDDRVEAAHDRIRELVLAELAPERRRALHWAIGEHLLAALGSKPAGDELFAIADHLDAGLPSLDSLATQRRLELAELALRAGERALASTAWTSARRYLGLGHRLVEPWLAAARISPATETKGLGGESDVGGRGPEKGLGGESDVGGRGPEKGPRDLCLAIAFARAQAEAMGESPETDAAFEDLLGWSLSAAELAPIVTRRTALLTFANRFQDAVDVSLVGLARLGIEFPRQPSLARGLVSIVLGWATLGRLGHAELAALPIVSDERAKAQLDVLAQACTAAFYANPILAFVLIGRMNRLMHRHGYHLSACRVLSVLAMSIGIAGRVRSAGAMCDRALWVAEQRGTDPISHIYALVTARYMVGPATRPLPELLSDIDALHADACDYGLLGEAGTIAVVGSDYHLESNTSLPHIRAMLARFEARNPGFGSALYLQIGTIVRGVIDSLIQGTEPLTAGDLDDDASPLVRCFATAKQLSTLVFRGDYEPATALMDQIAASYERLMIGMIHIPRTAMMFAILESRRYAQTRRRSSLRLLRRHVAVTQRWAKNCPHNFQAMAEIATAELARATGRTEQAIDGYERARTAASAQGLQYLVGLACMRLADYARSLGRTLSADGAWAAGLGAYEVWGAKALVSSLRGR